MGAEAQADAPDLVGRIVAPSLGSGSRLAPSVGTDSRPASLGPGDRPADWAADGSTRPDPAIPPASWLVDAAGSCAAGVEVVSAGVGRAPATGYRASQEPTDAADAGTAAICCRAAEASIGAVGGCAAAEDCDCRGRGAPWLSGQGPPQPWPVRP